MDCSINYLFSKRIYADIEKREYERVVGGVTLIVLLGKHGRE